MFLPPLKTPPIIHSKPIPNPLPNHISRHHNYEFHILYRAVFNHFPSRDIVRIRSIHIDSKKIKDFMCYRSKSELGVWRLASMNSNKTFDKYDFGGSTIFPNGQPIDNIMEIDESLFFYGDYVQTTCIYIPLQCFINSVFDKLLICSDIPNQQYCLIQDYETFIKSNGRIIISYNNGYYYYPNSVHNVNSDITQDVILNHRYTYSENVIEENEENYGPYSTEILSLTRENHTYNDFEKLNRLYNSVGNLDTNMLENFKNDVNKLSETYEYLCTDKYCDWNFNFEDVIDYHGIIYKTQIKHKTSGELFILYYINGKMNNCYREKITESLISKGRDIDVIERCIDKRIENNITKLCDSNEDVYSPLTFIPINGDYCNSYGLYSQYIPCGRLVGKIFDYEHQIYLEDKIMCTNDYAFSGIYYNELFPFKEASLDNRKTRCKTYRRKSINSLYKRKSNTKKNKSI